MSSSVEFLTRTGCTLCGESEPLVRQIAAMLGMRVERIDIDTRTDLSDEFHTRVPVVRLPGGAVLAEGRLDRARVTRAMLRARIRRT